MIKVNGVEIKITKFPNGEANVDTSYLNELKTCNDKYTDIDFKWQNDEDILHLIFVLEHLKELDITRRILNIYYLPYSRMDRNQNGNCFTLKHLITLLNNTLLETDNVFILEPHSSVSLNIKNSQRVNVITPLMNNILDKQNIDIICYPDKGARDRFGADVTLRPLIYCNKKRDFDTGNILGLELVSDVDIKGNNILILDDLSSKGGTFYYTAKKLKEEGANDIFLGVCHMESTVLQGEIIKPDSNIKHIYCMDTMLDKDVVQLLNKHNCTIYDTEFLLNQNQFKFVEE